MKNHKKQLLIQKIPTMKLILGGYIFIILIAAGLLSLPFASADGSFTPFTDSLFTATSATCVTGLIRYDTFTHWSTAGHIILICLIQIGGLGFVTVAMLLMSLSKRHISLSERSVMQDSISAPQLGGIVKMTRFIVGGSFLIEGVGAILLMFDFIPRFGKGKGIWYAVFHSISAFCNGGFDLMGGYTGECNSLIGFEGNLFVNLVLMALIIIGGLGFFVWRDLIDKKFRFGRLALQSKIVLSVSAGLVVLGGILIAVFEWNGPMFEGYSAGDKILSSFFQSVSARTAGFNSADLSKMTEPGLLIMIFLMLIGGSTGSTAGGMKTTTFWILCVSVFTTYRRKKNIEAFGRRMDEGITRTASCIFMTYLFLILTSTVIITAIEKLPLLVVLFETTSAAATVGITLGITGSLSMVSKLIITFLMLCGRVGSITILLAFSSNKQNAPSRLPLEHIQIG